ncbi:MAG: pyruvate, phosphate dikinase [Deltaproteobacteria bacterium]|nr:pyruvate, phosphate dikinase [Deltaproteobacteria bacterium]
MSKHVYFFGGGKADGSAGDKNLLGGKGANLAEMVNLGIPVPPGFTITTEVCTAYFAAGNKYPDGLTAQVEDALSRVEKLLSKKFGDANNPLLFSVRSGSRASMPGMMDTILNLGLNDEIAAGLAKKTANPRFVYDAYRRFIAMYCDIVLEVKKEHFEVEIDVVRRQVAKGKGIDISKINAEELKKLVPDSMIEADDLKSLVETFKGICKKHTGKDFPSDPKEQLWGAVGAVFRSWHNARAKTYRKMNDIPESWGTACNVQSMVFGNLGETSATGVAFTRDPSTGENVFYGEWLPNAQGEDVVAGIRTPFDITKAAATAKGNEGTSLEEKMPQSYATLRDIYLKLEKHYRDMMDIEFTIEDGTLFMLQCRVGKRTGPASVRMAVEMAQEGIITKEEAILRVDPSSIDQLLHPRLDPKAEKKFLAKGLPASPGAAAGHVVFTADEAEKQAKEGKKVLLVRTETSPEDIHGMDAAQGILTARGGMTSHAAVVARGMGKCCVAGCSAINIDYKAQTMTVSVYDDAGKPKETVVIKAGDLVTLDGSAGRVYQGAVPTVPAQLTGSFGTLMEWADSVRKLKVRTNADTPKDARVAREFGAQGIGLCRTEHMFFAEDRIAAVREMILSETEEQRRKALVKLLPFQREDFVGIFKAMNGLPVTIRTLDPPLHEFLPHENHQITELSKTMAVEVTQLLKKNADLHEFNPMLGHRGVRLAISYPEIAEMQFRAIFEAAKICADEGVDVQAEVMIPLSMTKRELDLQKELFDRTYEEVFKGSQKKPRIMYGTMIELPRAALMAAELAKTAEFFSFGTNDLTQTTMGLSRDDAGRFLPDYVRLNIFAKDPFQCLDAEGVGQLVSMACERGKATRPDIKLGICGEHGGDPQSIEFCHKVGLNYVSCSPYRVPIARLAAAHAVLKEKGGKAVSNA